MSRNLGLQFVLSVVGGQAVAGALSSINDRVGHVGRSTSSALGLLDGLASRARQKLTEMGQALQRNGNEASRLSGKYQLLNSEVASTNSKHAQAEQMLQRQQALVNGLKNAWAAIGSSVAGVTAGGAVLAQPTKKALTYEEQLAYMTDTAGAGKSVQEKQALQKQMSGAIERARQASRGATREEVAGGLSTMLASGAFSDEEALRLLPVVSQTKFAADASAEDVAKQAIAYKQFGLSEKQITEAFDRSVRAGQLGSFEMKNMSRWQPAQLAMARGAGFTGMEGLTDLLALNQVAMSTAGSQDEAGNNVVNLLQKLSSRELSESMAKAVDLRKGDPTEAIERGRGSKKKVVGQEFSWTNFQLQQREKGINSVDALGMIVERQLESNKDYQKLKNRLKSASTDEEKKATLSAMSNIAEASEVGKLIADRQALMASLASLNGQARKAELKDGISKADGAVVQSADFLGQQNFAKSKLLSGNVDRANENTYNQLSGPLGTVIDKLNQATQQFPGFTTALYGATLAVSALAAAGAGAGMYKMFAGGAATAAAPAAASAVGGGAAAAGAGTANGASRLAKAGRLLGRAAMPLAVGVAVLDAGSALANDKLSKVEKAGAVAGAGGALAGGLAGAKLGALVGTAIFPGVGTVIGSAIGGVGGALAGQWLGKKAVDVTTGGKPAVPVAPATATPATAAPKAPAAAATPAAAAAASSAAAKAAGAGAQAAPPPINVTVDYKPQLTIQGDPIPGQAEKFAALLRENAQVVADLVNRAVAEKARVSFKS